MSSRNAWVIGLLVGLTGCESSPVDLSALCLQQHNNSPKCCIPGAHVDHGTCCGVGTHAVSDVQHPDWKICIFDEDAGANSGACQDAGTDAEADTGADAQ